MVKPERIWITGASRTGKTTQLMEQFCDWMRSLPPATPPASPPGILLVAAIGDNRLELVDRFNAATQNQYPVYSTTPLGFVQDEMTLFYPLLVQQLNLTAQFPIAQLRLWAGLSIFKTFRTSASD